MCVIYNQRERIIVKHLNLNFINFFMKKKNK